MDYNFHTTSIVFLNVPRCIGGIWLEDGVQVSQHCDNDGIDGRTRAVWFVYFW